MGTLLLLGTLLLPTKTLAVTVAREQCSRGWIVISISPRGMLLSLLLGCFHCIPQTLQESLATRFTFKQELELEIRFPKSRQLRAKIEILKNNPRRFLF